MTEAVILDALRTPIGRYGGVLASVRPDDLAAHVVRAAVERNELDGRAHDVGGQVVGPDARQHTAVAADRGPQRVEDHCLCHGP